MGGSVDTGLVLCKPLLTQCSCTPIYGNVCIYGLSTVNTELPVIMAYG